MTNKRPRAIYLLWRESLDRIYGARERADVAALLKDEPLFVDPREWRGMAERLGEVEMVFSGWGMVKMDETFLATFPQLRVVFYGAGSVRGFVTDASWDRGVRVTSANAMNAVPVCEFTVAQIVLAAKQAWRLNARTRELRSFPPMPERESPGMYGAVIGLISLGAVGRMVVERLRDYDVRVLAYDPYVDPVRAAELGVTLCSLEELFAKSDVVSCHAPLLETTERMLTREHFASMKRGATFINTARGGVVDEEGLIEVLAGRPDLQAVLDVTHPEPPRPDSPLYTLPNVFLTPHIAGSKGGECRRLGRTMVDELRRYLHGQSLRFEVCREQALRMA